ncbi:MAG: hypothetical protein FWE74_07520 [Oscillospiraceae bacterium]|nr:hypothetical protein [Oscillospiraceae bacterium]
MDFLENLFSGNIVPINEQIFKRDMQKKITDAESELLKLLDGKDKELFESFVSTHIKLNYETALENFRIGFKFACKLNHEGLK